MSSNPTTVLLTGATGYVGGRLLPVLLHRGYRVRCLTRRASHLDDHEDPRVEVVYGDVQSADSLASAMQGIDTVIYLIHSLGSNEDYAKTDFAAAENFSQAARNAGVRRIVYLSGLGDPQDNLSKHLRSRQATGEALRSAGAPVIELRASIIIGSGSASFEMIRALVRRLPVMICPRWVRVLAQPISIDDVLSYLAEAVELDCDGSRMYEIGGPEPCSYGEIMQEYAKQRKLRRWMIPVPLLTPYLSSLWLGLVTPLYARVGRKLVEGMRNETIVRDDAALSDFSVRPIGLEQAIALAMQHENEDFAQTRWSDAFSSGGEPKQWGGVRFGSRLVDSRTQWVEAPTEVAFEPVRKIGGQTGWYYGDWLWRVRGFLDLLIGGVGVRRGRRDPEHLRPGDALDFWRVEAYEPNQRLLLAAEMKAPGRAWLEFEVTPKDGGSTIRQTAIFDPVGLLGLGYWYALYPLHALVFRGMLRNLAKSVQTSAARAQEFAISKS